MSDLQDHAGTPESAPNWAEIKREILCPLCEYNLRGLADPRCPECGHISTWTELLDPDATHPWLFEHRTRRRIRALLHTFIASQQPRRFWRSVRPALLPKPRALFVYWVVCAAVLVLEGTGLWGVRVLDYYRAMYEAREMVQRTIEQEVASGSTTQQLAQLLKEFGSPSAVAKAMYPTSPLWDVIEFSQDWNPSLPLISVQMTCAMLAWPWLTVGALLVFRQTMRKGRVRAAHVVRCAVYSCDSTVLILPLLVWWLVGERMEILRVGGHLHQVIDSSSLMPIVAMIALLAYRLGNAYRLYLQFPHPFAVALASQLIVALTLLAIAPWTILL